MRKFLIMALLIFSTKLVGQIKKNNAITVSEKENQGVSPYFTQNKNGEVFMSWCEKDKSQKVKFYFSKFNGNTFENKIQIACPENVSTHAEGKPMIAIHKNGTIYASFEIKKTNPKSRFASDLLYVFSTDNGTTWSAANYFQPDRSLDKSQSFCKLIRLVDGEIGAAWLDEKLTENGRSVKFAKTLVNGNFGEPILLDNQACECCRIEAIVNTQNELEIYYRDIFEEKYRDIVLVKSSNNGQSFSKPNRLYNDNWEIDACPHAGPTVANHNGITLVSYYTSANNKARINLVNKPSTLLASKNTSAVRTPQLATNSKGQTLWIYCQKNEGKRENIGVLYGEKVGLKNSKKVISSEKEVCNNPTLIGFKNSWILAYEATDEDNKVRVKWQLVN